MSEEVFEPEAILRTLVARGIEFVIIGGVAARILGSPILTRDLDICYSRAPKNLDLLAAALRELGAKLRGTREEVPFRLDARSLAAGDSFIFTTTRGSFDIIGTPLGTNGYEELVANATEMQLGTTAVMVASLDDLIRMKRAAGRLKDRMMLEELGALREEIQKKERRRR